MELRVKVNAVNLFNRAIELIENLLEDKICPNCEENIEVDYETKENSSGIDIGFQIIHNYLKDIGERAIKINDAVILESLINLGIVKCTDDEENKIKDEAKAIKEDKQ